MSKASPNKNLDQLFAKVCKDLRYATDIAWIAEASGVSSALLYLWRQGKITSPRACNLISVAEVLGYSISWK